jgi:hypothetical protein
LETRLIICTTNGFTAAVKDPNSPAFDTYICYNP